ncbi:hypothetical protein BG53_14870 [Paenibacillus darwinianus]|uniref:Uncharacterized protein n=1 Tax=Paenibacillus darwinianus TaxID=1380763 RepID=A0A9W5S294_9BACL|nr:hypothetical protein BG52_07360 [Paenibacillus darwinianus]EXX88791.1 hypothetical protein CH50_02770 [Paenibacillus darwinianus]EXX89773.1 hypothetical protein BG53_14870 [Paenibacillus darwinianus]
MASFDSSSLQALISVGNGYKKEYDRLSIDYRVRGFKRDISYTKDKLSPQEQKQITRRVQTEMDEIFYGKNMSRMETEENGTD